MNKHLSIFKRPKGVKNKLYVGTLAFPVDLAGRVREVLRDEDQITTADSNQEIKDRLISKLPPGSYFFEPEEVVLGEC